MAISLYMPEPATIERTASMTATEKYFSLKLASGKDLGHLPGQFVMVSIPGIGEAPISVSSSPTLKGRFEFVVRKVGNVTGAMHKMSAGQILGIRGPFGTHFPHEETKGKDILFVAGGLGLVPARSFINYILDNRKKYGRITILFGSRTPAERLFVDELCAWKRRDDIKFLETVDRGDETWKGNTGVITRLFPQIDIDPKKTACVIVGPPIMYRFVIIELKKKEMLDKNVHMSLERRMKCGVGKCGHCQIGSYYCCQDGPVFSYAKVKALAEAL